MATFTIDQETTVLYENTRTDMLKRMLQKETSDLEGFVTVVPNAHGDYHKFPFISKSELTARTELDEDIKAEEMKYNIRGIKPLMMQKWHKLLPDHDNFTAGLPITCTNVINELKPALARAKDEIIMGTITDINPDSPTVGEYVIRKHDSFDGSADDGNPLKMGTTSGYFGDAYAGKTGDVKIALPFQPYIDNTGLVTTYDEYDETAMLDLKKSNVVPVNYTGTGTSAMCGWTLEKFILAYEMLQARYAVKRGTIVHAITHRQAAEILRNEKFQNVLFGNQVLKSGLLDGLFGIKFLVTDCLPLIPIGNDKYARGCPIWVVEDLVFSVWDNAQFHLRPQPGKVNTVYVGTTFALGAGRLREESCVTMLCDEGFKPKGA